MSLTQKKRKRKIKQTFKEKEMDIKKLDSVTNSEAGVWFPILLEGERTGIEIKLQGIDSKAFKKEANSIRKYVSEKNKKNENTDSAVMDEKSIQMLASCTLDWHDISEEGEKKGVAKTGLIVDGEVWKCNPENAMTLYSGYPFIADQVAAYVMDRSAFLLK